ncbi:cysteine--tRNA ligase [Oleiharenicola sp. Vm1]|uniref:cysteine--tRNA ligase n=1 Tax=Oleiharenicola sp. Vm1 TaxID=3398393 RepID=UPI0039F4C047
MPIRLYDSLTRTPRELHPGEKDGVFRFYNCGPTVYAPAHIGNFRTFVVNDVLRRLLELEFGPAKVKHVRNLTDVDDRTIGQAKKEQRPLGDITRHWTKLFHEDCAALNLLPPHAEPTATGYIKEQVDMIEVLMDKGHAYRAADGSVYFKLDSFPGYGRLSRIKERELKVTNTVADADHKDSVSDFALWKAYKPEEDGLVSWAGPRGAAAGRPGWHIECSAMSKSILGDTIDLHTGGVDLLFPHHENEIAQSECCNGTPFARHWYHSEHLLVNGTTMSKSKGNYYTVRDLLAKGHSPLAIRYALLSGHPRKQLNFTLESLHAAESALKKLQVICTVFHDPKYRVAGNGAPSRLVEVLDLLRDDLNTPGALGALFKLGHEIMTGVGGGPTDADVATLDQILGVLGFEATKLNTLAAAPKAEAPDAIKALADKRWAAKAAKDFAAADALRQELTAAGWSMLDRKDGYSLEPLKK